MEPSSPTSIDQPRVTKGASWQAALTEGTVLAKVTAAIVIIMLPLLGFWVGMQYGQLRSSGVVAEFNDLQKLDQTPYGDLKKIGGVEEVNGESSETTEGKYANDAFRWVIAYRADDSLLGKRQRLSLMAGEKEYVVGDYNGCTDMEESNATLLSGEITRTVCRADGGGFDVSVFYENNEYVVKERTVTVSAEGIETVGTFATKFVIE